VRLGSTNIQATAPVKQSAAATKNDAVQPKCCAISGVSHAVSQPPACAPMFMNPETDPEDGPARSAVTDQKELCARYRAPAPPRQCEAGDAGAFHFRAEHKEYRRQRDDRRRQVAASDSRTVGAREAIADYPSQRTAHRHGQKRKHRIKRAGLQVQSA